MLLYIIKKQIWHRLINFRYKKIELPMSILASETSKEQTTDFMPINGTDYLELYVSNAKQAAYFYKSAFGFQSLAYAGLETGLKDRESYVVVQDKIRLILTSPLHSDTVVGKHIDDHGDGVKEIALWVDDATYAYDEAIKRGARSICNLRLKRMILAK